MSMINNEHPGGDDEVWTAPLQMFPIELLDPIRTHNHGDEVLASLEAVSVESLEAHLDTERGDTPLTWAARHGNEVVVKLLLGRGAQVDGVTERGGTALYIACQENHAGCVQILLDCNANVDQSNQRGITPLAVSCRNDNVKCAEKVLAAGAEVDKVLITIHTSSITAFYVACQRGHLDCVQLLSSYGAIRSFDDGM